MRTYFGFFSADKCSAVFFKLLLFMSLACTGSAQAFYHPEEFTKAEQCTVGRRVLDREGRMGTITRSGPRDWCSYKLDNGKQTETAVWMLRPASSGAPPTYPAGQSAKVADAKTGRGAGPSGHPPLGVYTCTLPGIGIFHGAFFGLIDGTTYRNFDRKRGAYTYDPASKVLSLTSGSSKGLRYVRTDERVFRVLDDKGQVTGGTCVHTQKPIDGAW